MTPEELTAHLTREAECFEAVAAKYRALAEAEGRGDYGYGVQTQSLRIAAEAGARLNQALHEWAAWAAAHPPAPSTLCSARDRPGGRAARPSTAIRTVSARRSGAPRPGG